MVRDVSSVDLVDHEGGTKRVVVNDLLHCSFNIVVPVEFLQCILVSDL